MPIRLKPQTESAFLRQVLDLSRLRGWRSAHFRASRTKRGWRTAVQGDGKGFPDLLLIRPPRLIVAELKLAGKWPSQEQDEWLKAFQFCPGVDAFVWRPSDWEELKKVLW